MRRGRGMTLVELLVTVVLFAILTGSTLWLLAVAKGAWQAGTSRMSVRQEVQTTLWQVNEELRDSESALLTDGTALTPKCFSFPSAVDAGGVFNTDSTGDLVWKKYVVYYLSNKKLLRSEVYTTFADPAVPLTTAQLQSYCSGGSLVAGGVNDFGFAVDAETGLVTFSITLQAANNLGKLDVISGSIDVNVRN